MSGGIRRHRSVIERIATGDRTLRRLLCGRHCVGRSSDHALASGAHLHTCGAGTRGFNHSAPIASCSLAAGLVDELRLLIYPVILGHGKRLFGDDGLASAFSLEHLTSTPGGVLITRYSRNGALGTGAFE